MGPTLWLKWYQPIWMYEHPHKGSEKEMILLRPGTEVTNIRRAHDPRYCWGTIPTGQTIAFKMTELIDHWPPREDE